MQIFSTLYCLRNSEKTKCLYRFSTDVISFSIFHPWLMKCVQAEAEDKAGWLYFYSFCECLLTILTSVLQRTFVGYFLLSTVCNYSIFTWVCMPPRPNSELSVPGLAMFWQMTFFLQPQWLLSGLLNYIKDRSFLWWCGLLCSFSP